MQGATWRDKGATGHDEDNGKRIESPSATVCPCRSLQKMDFQGLFSNAGPLRTTFSKLVLQIAPGKKSWFKIPIIYMYKCVGVSLVAK